MSVSVKHLAWAAAQCVSRSNRNRTPEQIIVIPAVLSPLQTPARGGETRLLWGSPALRNRLVLGHSPFLFFSLLFSLLFPPFLPLSLHFFLSKSSYRPDFAGPSCALLPAFVRLRVAKQTAKATHSQKSASEAECMAVMGRACSQAWC